jgi:pimeloyl-ACP methyl ester carboxylesterase
MCGVSTGVEVESLVYRRKSLADSATPGVLFLHGGPHSAVSEAFAGPMLALVAEGYTVVLPNYRGSSGYGEAHLKALPGKAGTVRFDSIRFNSLVEDFDNPKTWNKGYSIRKSKVENAIMMFCSVQVPALVFAFQVKPMC